jgi:hypothetical protein
VSPSPIIRSSTCSNTSSIVPLGSAPTPGPASPTPADLAGREAPVGVADFPPFFPVTGTLSPQVWAVLRVSSPQVFR